MAVSLIRSLNQQSAPRCCQFDFRPAVGDDYLSFERIRDVLIKYKYLQWHNDKMVCLAKARGYTSVILFMQSKNAIRNR